MLGTAVMGMLRARGRAWLWDQPSHGKIPEFCTVWKNFTSFQMAPALSFLVWGISRAGDDSPGLHPSLRGLAGASCACPISPIELFCFLRSASGGSTIGFQENPSAFCFLKAIIPFALTSKVPVGWKSIPVPEVALSTLGLQPDGPSVPGSAPGTHILKCSASPKPQEGHREVLDSLVVIDVLGTGPGKLQGCSLSALL